MGKLYIWNNDGDTKFNTGDLAGMFGNYVSGQHSGGYVVLADDITEAINFVMADNRFEEYRKEDIKTPSEIQEYLKETCVEKPLEKGIIYYGDGDC